MTKIVLESESLRIIVDPLVGGTIIAVEHLALGLSVLGTVPWTPRSGPAATFAAPNERAWLEYYTGGWPILFPNGGGACEFDGVFHGFHGEASLAPWEASADAGVVRLKRRFASVPVEMSRELSVEGELLIIRESVRMLGDRPIKVMWGHHPTFGSDLLAGSFAIETGARSVAVDDRYDPDANPLEPGASGRWPLVPGKAGPVDLSRPNEPIAAVAYLHDFDGAWISIRRLDGAIAAALSWDAKVFPCAWLWLEIAGTREPPWRGKARLIGLEPNTTWPANGLADAERRGARMMTLEPGASVETAVRLNVFKPDGSIRGIDENGFAISQSSG
jgi:hypothetical protein